MMLGRIAHRSSEQCCSGEPVFVVGSVAATVAPSVRTVPATAKYATELANANVNVYTLMKLLGKRASGSYVRRSNCRRCQLARAKERSARSGSATMSDSPT
jgi:hypothetical protein